MVATKRSIFLIELFCLALLILISGTEALNRAVNIERCSDYPDCNATLYSSSF